MEKCNIKQPDEEPSVRGLSHEITFSHKDTSDDGGDALVTSPKRPFFFFFDRPVPPLSVLRAEVASDLGSTVDSNPISA